MRDRERAGVVRVWLGYINAFVRLYFQSGYVRFFDKEGVEEASVVGLCT